ncbi:MAG: hypothetical protein APF76_02165 [Desulfitibacter sp. BRH_c19]|nr:MAG: hypothetical protein APF76_02165 [Desulfitibacter sp. BRH_c19]
MRNFLGSLKNKIKNAKVDKLIRNFLSMEQQISPWVINSLQELSEEEVTYVLKEVYPNLESYLQKQLLVVLEDIGYMKMIYNKLNKGSEKEILFSLDLLGLLKPFKALDFIFKRLADNRESIRFEAAHTLILYKNKKVVELTVKELKEDSSCLPARLAQILVGYGSIAALELINNINNPKLSNVVIIEILGLLEFEKANDITNDIINYKINGEMLKCLDSPNIETRVAALKYLAGKKDISFKNVFEKAISGSSDQIKQQMYKSLKNLGTKEAMDVVMNNPVIIDTVEQSAVAYPRRVIYQGREK